MRKVIISVMIAFLSTLTFGQVAPGKGVVTREDLPSLTNSIEQDKVESMLRDFLRQSSPSRFAGTIGHKSARQFIIDQIKNGQLDKSEILVVQNFKPDVEYSIELFNNDFNQFVKGQIPESDPEYSKWENYTNSSINTLKSLRPVDGANIIWEKKGTDLQLPGLLLLCHYDTMVYNKTNKLAQSNLAMPGADHNASGVVASLQLIKVLQRIQLKRTIRVIFLDMEAVGFLGSRNISLTDDLKKFSFVINLLALGHDSVGQDKQGIEGNRVFYGRKDIADDRENAKYLISAGNALHLPISISYIDNSFRQGSTFPLWDRNMSGLVFTHDWDNDSNEDRIFTPDDFIETLNLKTLTNSIKYISAGVISWALSI